MLSTRTPANLTPNRLTQALSELQRAGRTVIDLTESNPTRAGFDYPPDLLAPLADPRGLRYDPQPLGLPDARRAVAADYLRRQIVVAPERIVLTASTSEAYSWLFKLLADPGDEVLVPRPSYPLFDHLTRLDAVVAKPYDLEYHGRWTVDLESVRRALTPRSRALLVVTPNNPTGSFVAPGELDSLCTLCAEHDAALIADEVFADYELEPGAARAAARPLERTETIVFSLGGLSKSIGLPQAKLAWIAVGGPSAAAVRALERLELVSDTYLSVSTLVQAAAPVLLQRGAPVRDSIRARVAANYRRLVAETAASPACRVLRAEGGWSAVLQVPSFGAEEELILDLLIHDRVLTHPGYFFDFPRESYLVVSLLVTEPAFSAGIERILARASTSGMGPPRNVGSVATPGLPSR